MIAASRPYVIWKTIKAEVRGREAEIIRALGIPWHGRDHIHCPYPGHPDKDPSWRLMESGLAICTCREAHSVFDATMAMEGIDFEAAKIRVAELIGRRDLIIDDGRPGNGITLEQYAAAKKLPIEFLKTEFGITQSTYRRAPCLDMPYVGQPGDKEPYPVKRRIALGGKDKTKWKRGHKARLYGLWRLPQFKQRNEIILVEGESDLQTCWFCGDFPALGLPGAGGWNEERDVGLLDGVSTIYAIIEPGAAAANLLKKLARSTIRDRLRIVRMSPEAKDPSALFLLNPEGFAEAFRRLLDAAEQPPPPPEEPESDPIAELNKTFAVIRVANRVAILSEHLDDDGLPTFSLLSPDSFKLWMANRRIEINHERAPVAAVWLGHPRRRQYEGMTFAPQGAPPGYYNLWTGFAYQPSTSGSCEKFKDHLRDNVCGGNDRFYDWVFGWFADIFQNPAQKPGTSLVLRGEMGVGKSIVGFTFGELLGLHHAPVGDPRYVTGRFNAHLVRCLLFHCDEAFWAGDQAAAGKIRDLITGKKHPIEFKGIEAFFIRNYIRMLVIGPPGWIVPAGIDERRFATFDVADTKKQNHSYFKAIANELEENNNSGYKRLLHELLEFDLTKVELRKIPRTKALLDQKIASLSPEDAWWLDILKNGLLPHYSNTAKAGRCPGKLLYDHYIDHANKQGVRRRQIETALARFLRDRALPANTIGSAVETFTIKDATPPFGPPAVTDRGTVYMFPKLKECREFFEKRLQQSLKWSEPTEWQTRQAT